MRVVGFGYKMAWIAGRSDSSAVVAALKLTDVRPASWEDGVASAYASARQGYGTSVFVTPPIDGWVLAARTALFRLLDSRPPEFADFVAKLSGHLGGTEVQFFSTHRVVESHAWARASHGACTRAYNFVGESCETVEDLGEPSPEETALGFAFFDERSADADDDTYWDREDLDTPSEEHVMRLAEKWSVNPSVLGEISAEVDAGVLGEIAVKADKAGQADRAPTRQRPWWKFW